MFQKASDYALPPQQEPNASDASVDTAFQQVIHVLDASIYHVKAECLDAESSLYQDYLIQLTHYALEASILFTIYNRTLFVVQGTPDNRKEIDRFRKILCNYDCSLESLYTENPEDRYVIISRALATRLSFRVNCVAGPQVQCCISRHTNSSSAYPAADCAYTESLSLINCGAAHIYNCEMTFLSSANLAVELRVRYNKQASEQLSTFCSISYLKKSTKLCASLYDMSTGQFLHCMGLAEELPEEDPNYLAVHFLNMFLQHGYIVQNKPLTVIKSCDTRSPSCGDLLLVQSDTPQEPFSPNDFVTSMLPIVLPGLFDVSTSSVPHKAYERAISSTLSLVPMQKSPIAKFLADRSHPSSLVHVADPQSRLFHDPPLQGYIVSNKGYTPARSFPAASNAYQAACAASSLSKKESWTTKEEAAAQGQQQRDNSNAEKSNTMSATTGPAAGRHLPAEVLFILADLRKTAETHQSVSKQCLEPFFTKPARVAHQPLKEPSTDADYCNRKEVACIDAHAPVVQFHELCDSSVKRGIRSTGDSGVISISDDISPTLYRQKKGYSHSSKPAKRVHFCSSVILVDENDVIHIRKLNGQKGELAKDGSLSQLVEYFIDGLLF